MCRVFFFFQLSVLHNGDYLDSPGASGLPKGYRMLVVTWGQNLGVLNSFWDQQKTPWVCLPFPPAEQSL